MIPNHKYLIGDSYGYDEVICLGQPTIDEIKSYFGSVQSGIYVKVKEENTEMQILFESDGYFGSIYVEQR